MVGYLKDRLTFKTYKKIDVLDSELELVKGSIYDTSSKAKVRGELDVPLGDFFILDDFIGVITESEPSNGFTKFTIGDVLTIFNRTLLYNETTLTIETFISRSIRINYVASGDTVYDRPYIQIRTTSSTDFLEPIYEDQETYYTYDLASYIGYVRAAASVYTDVSFTNDNLIFTVGRRLPNTVNVIFGEAGFYLSSEAYSQDSVSKVTALNDGYEYNYYLLEDGSITDIYPDKKKRAEGTWVTINVSSPIDSLNAVCTNPDITVSCDPDMFASLGFNSGTYTFEFSGRHWRYDGSVFELSEIGITVSGEPVKDDKLYAMFKLKGNMEEEVYNEFSSHSHSHSIEFYSIRKIDFFDTLNIRIRNKVFTSYASEVVYKGTDRRYFVKSGELSTKLTEKLSKVI